MRKILLSLLFILSVKSTFAQLAADGSTNKVFVASIGVRQLFMNNGQFDSWTEKNYNKKINFDKGAMFDLAFYFKKYDAGLDVSGTSSSTFIDFYFGKKLTPPTGSFSSYLNFFIGGMELNRYDLEPLDYTPTQDQQGKKMELNYSMTYLGLSSRNYFNKTHIRFGKHKKTSLNSGFYVSAGYDPFNDRGWKYGYDDTADNSIDSNGDTTTPFKSVDVHNVPLLNRFFMEAGIFVGIGN